MTIGGERGNPIPVTSVAQEYELIRAASCPCGGRWEPGKQVAYFDPLLGKHCDRVELTCLKCGENREIHFDISGFYGTPPRDGQPAKPTQAGRTITDTRGRFRPWMRWLLVLPAAFVADLLAQWFASPSGLVRTWEAIRNQTSPFGPFVDAITWQAWAPAWFVWAGAKVAPSRRARVSVCLAGFKVVVASANILARIPYVQRGGSWWRLEDPPLDVPVWWFAGASALGILAVTAVSARTVLKERPVGDRERRKGMGYNWFWYVPTCLTTVVLLVTPAVVIARERLAILFESFGWWELLFSFSSYPFFSATLFSILGPVYPLGLIPLFFADKQDALYHRRHLWSALCVCGSVVVSYVALFLCWGSFPLIVDANGATRLRMFPFLPWP